MGKVYVYRSIYLIYNSTSCFIDIGEIQISLRLCTNAGKYLVFSSFCKRLRSHFGMQYWRIVITDSQFTVVFQIIHFVLTSHCSTHISYLIYHATVFGLIYKTFKSISWMCHHKFISLKFQSNEVLVSIFQLCRRESCTSYPHSAQFHCLQSAFVSFPYNLNTSTNVSKASSDIPHIPHSTLLRCFVGFKAMDLCSPFLSLHSQPNVLSWVCPLWMWLF